MKTRYNIKAAKLALPLPSLLQKLGLKPPTGGGNMFSPFVAGRRQRSPSFSIFQRGGGWGWCDRTGGVENKGDEITLLEKLKGLSRGEAIAYYVALAGVQNSCSNSTAHFDKAAVSAVRGSRSPNSPGLPDKESFDWSKMCASFTDADATELVRWRGIDLTFIEWLRRYALIGRRKGKTAFPVHNKAGQVISAHVRLNSKRWTYFPEGLGCHPFTFGDPASALRTMVFESQWDAFAVMAAVGWHETAPKDWAVLITRGSSNGRFAVQVTGKVYAWTQNDELKDGKRAAEGWFHDVLAHAPGAVFQVAIPKIYKDANDWLRAAPVDVWGALDDADIVDKPALRHVDARGEPPTAVAAKTEAKPNETNIAAAAKNGGTPPFNPSAVLDKLGLFWLNGSPCYFRRLDDKTRPRFLELSAEELKRKLRVRGYRHRCDPQAGETVSQIDRILDEATETRAVDFAVNVGGTPAGVYDLPGGRVLVRESPRLVLPKEGDFQNIKDLLTALLGEDTILFCCWLKVGYEALRAGQRRSGQALFIIGPPDCGKSRIQHQVITPMLAGRSADPKSYFFGRTDFNAELVGAEHLLIEEIPSSSRHEERLFFGERIKEVVANDTARLHKKNRDAVTVTPFWRLSITLNDNPEKLRCLPPLSKDLSEKIIMLSAKPAPQYWERFDDEPDPRQAFRDAVTRELPAFAHYLLGMPIPPEWRGRRYGVRSYIPEEIGHTISEGEPAHHLLMLIDKGLPPEDEDDSKPWQGDAEDLKQVLCGESSSVRNSANRFLGSVPIATLGIWLSQLESQHPRRIRKNRTANKRLWIIQRPSLE